MFPNSGHNALLVKTSEDVLILHFQEQILASLTRLIPEFPAGKEGDIQLTDNKCDQKLCTDKTVNPPLNHGTNPNMPEDCLNWGEKTGKVY